ncbi:MAG: ATP-binding protein [Actinomycetota bacterium]|nr:ATP-binding protein [Actinomycetota bacterium]
MNAPIRVRLTAWYVAVLAIVLVGLGAFVVTRLRSDLLSELDRTLRDGAAQIAQGYEAEGAKDFRDVAHTVLPGPRRGSGAQVLAAAGPVVLSDGDPITETPLIAGAALRRALAGHPAIASVDRGSPPRHFRIIAIPVTRQGHRQVLVAAESLASIDRAVHRVLILLLVGGAAALALLALGGWWIARKALRPVERMTTRADRIGIDDLNERIAVPRVQDEVGHLARTLNAMLDRLQEGVEARQQLVADASHELRAPLAAMRSELEVSLRQDPLGDEARAVLASARDEVVRMGRIVDNLLTLARVDAGRLDLLVGAHDLRELATDAVRAHQAAADAAGVELTVEGEAIDVTVDRDRIHQVIANLVDNAIRCAPEGTAVTVAVGRDAGRAAIRVSDEGPGVPVEARQRIFERFARDDAARSRTGGAGLGLAICREIVRAHGGEIWVEDHAPRGSTFVVTLAATAGPARQRPPRLTAPAGRSPHPPG